MTKIDQPAAVREAARALKAAVDAATAAGYHVAWPTRPSGLDNVSISETAKAARVTVAVQAPAGADPIPPATVAKATTAAQKAVGKVVAADAAKA